MILVAGPYRSGTNDDPVLIQRNVDAMTETSLQLFRRGHLPVMGEWFALPLIEHAGSTGIGDPIFNEIFHPISGRLVAKCDACLRIGGPSAGADEMVRLARQHGKAGVLLARRGASGVLGTGGGHRSCRAVSRLLLAPLWSVLARRLADPDVNKRRMPLTWVREQ